MTPCSGSCRAGLSDRPGPIPELSLPPTTSSTVLPRRAGPPRRTVSPACSTTRRGLAIRATCAWFLCPLLFPSTVTDATCQESCYNRLPIGRASFLAGQEPSEKRAKQGAREWKSMGRRVTEVRLRGRNWKLSQWIANTCLKTMTSNNSGKRRRVLESIRRVRPIVTRVADHSAPRL